MSSRGTIQKLGAGFVLLSAIVALAMLAAAPLPWNDQLAAGAVTFALAIVLNWLSASPRVTMTLIFLSAFSSIRYFIWRGAETWRYSSVQGLHPDLIFIVLLIGAETYALVVMLLGYFQTIRPLNRRPVLMPRDTASWPVVDVLIPTYNEPLDIVRTTVMAARTIDWPADKLRVYLLDDGPRPEFREFAEQLGVTYFTRPDRRAAKAGNINAALKKTSGEYVVVLDCDHVPTRAFLQMTVGWFLRDPKLAMLQTPHHFYSPDPFERNLDIFRRVPNEGRLFYEVVQGGLDLWNASFFCGSAAVLRRTALTEVGGIAVETVTEDAHTSVRLQKKRWNTAYLNLPLIGGLATPTLSDHIKQRIRWARGLIQVLRLEKPLFAKGLRWGQRLCYFNCAIHFLYAMPRLIFLTSPLVYLLLGRNNFYGYYAAILAYALPHILVSTITNSRIHGHVRHSFWNEIYETVLSPYVILPTLGALINPRWGKFNVTLKARSVQHSYLDWRTAFPFLVLLALDVAGITAGVLRLSSAAPEDAGTLAVNLFWAGMNAVILLAAVATAYERRQVRQSTRVEMKAAAQISLPGVVEISGEVFSLSMNGAAIRVAESGPLVPGTNVLASMQAGGLTVQCDARVVEAAGGVVRLKFDSPRLAQQEQLTRLIFGRADSWARWHESWLPDNPIRSFFATLGVALRGAGVILRSLAGPPAESKPRIALSPAPRRALLGPLWIIVGMAALWFLTMRAFGAPVSQEQAPEFSNTFSDTLDLSALGYRDALTLRGLDGRATLQFGLPLSKTVTKATLKLHYTPAMGLAAEKSMLQVSLNGSAVASVPLLFPSEDPKLPTLAVIDLPSELFVSDNSLQIALAGQCPACTSEAQSGLRTLISAQTQLELQGGLLRLANQVGLLPAPFFFASSQRKLELPVVFGAPVDERSLEAAGVVASWFGMLADHRGARFPVSLNEIPRGNSIVLAEPGTPIAEMLELGDMTGPAIAVRTNPNDPFGSVLVLLGSSGDELLMAARALALRLVAGDGDFTPVSEPSLPSARQAYDAPRWIPSNSMTSLVSNSQPDQFKTYGDGSVPVYFRLPPDLYFGSRTSLPLIVAIQCRQFGRAQVNVEVGLNGQRIGSFSVLPEQEGKTRAETLMVPVSLIYPRNTLTVNFTYKGVEGRGTLVPEAIVLPETKLDLRNIPHFVRLPRLDLFANSGFPFTRRADLSGTTVILPDQPSLAQIGMYLEAAGFLSAQTGYPALRISVRKPADAALETSKDLLVISSLADRDLLEPWSAAMPARLSPYGFQVAPGAGLATYLRSGWASRFRAREDLEAALGSGPDAVVQGFMTNASVGTSGVAITTLNEGSVSIAEALSQAASAGAAASTVLVVNREGVRAFSLDVATTPSGSLSVLESFHYWIQQHVVLLPVFVIVLGFMTALVLQPWLNRRAQQRLRLGS